MTPASGQASRISRLLMVNRKLVVVVGCSMLDAGYWMLVAKQLKIVG